MPDLSRTAQTHMRLSPTERFDLQSRIVLQGDETARTELSAREGFEFPDLEGSRQSVAWLLRQELAARIEGGDGASTGPITVDDAVAAVMARLRRTRCVATAYQLSDDPDDYRDADDQTGTLAYTCQLPMPPRCVPCMQRCARPRTARIGIWPRNVCLPLTSNTSPAHRTGLCTHITP